MKERGSYGLKEIKSQGKEYQSLKYRDWYEIVGEKQEVDYRDKVKHVEIITISYS